MTITLTIDNYEVDMYLLEWSSDLSSPTYSIYVDGELVEQTTNESYVFNAREYENPFFEVLDDDSDPTYARRSRPSLCWYAPAGATRHVIEVYEDSTWTEIADLETGDRQAQSYLAPALSDGESATYRITAYDDAGNATDSITINFSQVRHPDSLDLSASFDDGTQTITISEAV